MSIQYFSFRSADGSAISKSFAVSPLVYPLASGSKVITSDPLLVLGGVQSLEMVANQYQVRVKSQSDSVWYLNVSSSNSVTASHNLISGSYITGAYSNTCFNFSDFLSSASVSTIEIKPVYKAVSFNESFILQDAISYSTNDSGSIIIPLVPMPYLVTFKGKSKFTPFQILVSGSSCTASSCIIADIPARKVVIPKVSTPYGSYPFNNVPTQSTASTYFQEKWFQFILADGTPVSNDFNIAPVNYPLSTGSLIITSDPLTISGSVDAQPIEMASNLYKIECNRKASNDWFLSTNGVANETASAGIVSGSYWTGSYASVLFDCADFELNPLNATKLTVTPLYSNVGFNSSFVLKDSLQFTLDEDGRTTLTLVPMPYECELYGKYKNTKWKCLPSGSCTASAIVVSGFNVSKVITPQNSANFSYTAQASDLRYLHYTGSIVFYTASNAVLAESSSYIGFNGNRAIKRNDPSWIGINVGGSTVTEFLNDFFFPFIPSTVSIGGNELYETGSSVDITTNGVVTPNDETEFGTGSVYKDGVLWHSITTIPPYAYSFTDNGVAVNHSYHTVVKTLDNGNIRSGTKLVSFVAPFLYGVSNDAGLSGTDLHALNVDVTPLANKAYTFNGTNTLLRFAYPSSYPDIVKAYDPNMFLVTDTLIQTIVPMVGLNGFTENYKLYTWDSLADFNGVYTFEF